MSSNYEIIVACPVSEFRTTIRTLANSTGYQEEGQSWDKILEITDTESKEIERYFYSDIKLRVPASEKDKENELFFEEASYEGRRFYLSALTDVTIVTGKKFMVLFFHAIYSYGSRQFTHSTALQKILYDLCRPKGIFALFYDEFDYYIMVDRENPCARRNDKDSHISTITIDVDHFLGPDDSRWISDACDDADAFVAYCLDQLHLLSTTTLKELDLKLPDKDADKHHFPGR